MDLRLLGPVAVLDGNVEHRIPARRQRSLLALLLLNGGQVVSASRLVEELWHGNPPRAAGETLHTHVTRLRRTLGPLATRLRTQSPGYVFELADDELDIDRFRRLRTAGWDAVRRGEHRVALTRLGQALAQWRGEPLADLPELAERQVDVAVLREQRVQAHEWYFDAGLELGRHAELLDDIRRLAAENPLRERFISQLMVALYRDHRRSEALAVYRQARAHLVEQIGIEPGAELARVHRRILEHDLPDPDRAAGDPAVLARPNQLPVDSDLFAGRDEESEAAAQALLVRGARPPLVAITGPGGIGKSALAVRVARRVAARYPDGQFYVDMRGSSPRPRPVREVLGRLLRDLGVEESAIPEDEDDRAAVYRGATAGRALLLVLDDVAEARSLRPLIPGDGSCGLLVTSRDRLSAVNDACRCELAPLTDAAGRWLFAQITGPARAADDQEAVAAVLRLCAGSPLAIRIAATRLAASRTLTAADLAQALADLRQRLPELAIDDLSVRTAFDDSRRRLSPDDALAFDLLGTVLGRDECAELGLDATARLFGAPRAAAARTLDRLAAVHLVQAPMPDRYRFHDLVKAYAFESAEALDPELARTGAEGLARWVLGRAAAADAQIAPQRQRVSVAGFDDGYSGFADRAQALAWCEENRDCLSGTVAQACVAGLHEQAWRICVAAWSFFELRGYVQDLLRAGEWGLRAARAAGDGPGTAWVHNGNGTALHRLGRLDEAEREYGSALEIRRGSGDFVGTGMSLSNLGVVQYGRDRADRAVDYFTEALSAFRTAGSDAGAAMALNNLGEADLVLGRFEDALQVLQEALELRRSLGNRRGEALTMGGIGKVLTALRREDEARQMLQAALEIVRELGDVPGEQDTQAALDRLDDRPART
jgi:DNA-binding SARP family transcriptional activator/Tfp pilus assembly protein PilF